jgi:hypothetical protein
MIAPEEILIQFSHGTSENARVEVKNTLDPVNRKTFPKEKRESATTHIPAFLHRCIMISDCRR